MKKILRSICVVMLSFAIAFVSIQPTFAADYRLYVVQRGDTMNKIARANGMRVGELRAINPGVKNINRIYVGQQLNISLRALSEKDKALLQSMFDADFYAKENPDVVEIYGDTEDRLFAHFIEYGLWETRQPNKDFNVNAYASAYDDLRRAFGDDVMAYYRHYDEKGKAEGRDITTIEKALTVVEAVKSVSPLNKAGSEETMYDTIIAKRKPVVQTQSAPVIDNTPAVPAIEIWAESVIDAYTKAVKDYAQVLDSIDGGERVSTLESSLAGVQAGMYIRTLELFRRVLNEDATELIDQYEDKETEISKAQDDFREKRNNYSNTALTEKFLSFPEGMSFYDYGMANTPRRETFEAAYEEELAVWRAKRAAQNFTYEGQIDEDGKIGVYGITSIESFVENAKESWQSVEPEIETYLSAASEAYSVAREAYLSSEPKVTDSKYATELYASEQAALAAYDADHRDWEDSEPSEQAYLDEGSNNYATAHAEWEADEPKAEKYFIAGYADNVDAMFAELTWIGANPNPEFPDDRYFAACEAFEEECIERLRAIGKYTFEVGLFAMQGTKK